MSSILSGAVTRRGKREGGGRRERKRKSGELQAPTATVLYTFDRSDSSIAPGKQ